MHLKFLDTNTLVCYNIKTRVNVIPICQNTDQEVS